VVAVRAHHVTVEHHFAQTPARVFAYLAEHEHLGELLGAQVTRLSDGDDGERNGVGSAGDCRSARCRPLRKR